MPGGWQVLSKYLWNESFILIALSFRIGLLFEHVIIVPFPLLEQIAEG